MLSILHLPGDSTAPAGAPGGIQARKRGSRWRGTHTELSPRFRVSQYRGDRERDVRFGPVPIRLAHPRKGALKWVQFLLIPTLIVPEVLAQPIPSDDNTEILQSHRDTGGGLFREGRISRYCSKELLRGADQGTSAMRELPWLYLYSCYCCRGFVFLFFFCRNFPDWGRAAVISCLIFYQLVYFYRWASSDLSMIYLN